MNKGTLEKFSMLRKGDRVLCAVSGGADSMCLLHYLHSHREELGIELMAAHYEHGLRGEESLRDAAFVQEWCRTQGIVCRVEHGDVLSAAALKGQSTEEAARDLRYDFLRRTAEELGCSKIATAHNADDNAETVIFNLTRGGGSAGLRGIPPVRGNIIRPLILSERKEIEEYLKENAVPHVEDSSNNTDDYSRNLIRHKVMPILRELNPAFAAAAARTSQLMRQDEEYIDSVAADFADKFFENNSIPLNKFRQLHPAVAARVVRRLCPQTLSMQHIETVTELAEGSGLAYTDLPGIRLRREQGRIYFGGNEKISIGEGEIIPGESLRMADSGLIIYADLTEFDKEINGLFKTYCLKYESICGNIICTGRRPGDKIRPLGRNCTKSLKSLFNEAGMTQYERDMSPVIRDEKGILAVPGLCISERAAASPGDRVIRLRIEKEQTGE